MVPEDWKVEPLSKLLEKIIDYRGQSVPKAKSGIPLITARNVRAGFIDFSAKEYVSEEAFDAWMSRGIPSKGDILFTTEAPLGNACRFPETGRYAVGQRTVSLRPNEKLLNAEYLLYFLLSERGQRLIDLRSSGSTAKGIKSSELKKVKITLPSELPEQKKIAQILSTWDNAISATERLLENSQQRKKALMQQLLTGKKRLPGFEGEWKEKPIAKTGKVISGGTPDTSKPDLWDGDVQWLTPTDITALSTHFIYDTPRKITQKGVKESSATLLPPGSLCVCTRASVGLMAISTTEITTNQGFKSVVPNEEHDVIFLYYLFALNRNIFIRYSSGSTFLELSKKDFERLVFIYPPFSEQQAIANVLTTADQEIDALQKRLDHLKQEKKALMQQLLTGKRRVQVDDAA